MEVFEYTDMNFNCTDYDIMLCELGLHNRTACCEPPPTPALPPKDMNQTVRIFLYSLIFLLSVLGNALIIAVLVRNKQMRTMTNLFLLSLAVSDLMLCLFCVPFTLIPNLMKDFIFGSGVCKIATYFMVVSTLQVCKWIA
ncbi:UNVERIFIED_CONTAM: hypothetical protein FKN15_020370 [Acipenser sinensis]